MNMDLASEGSFRFIGLTDDLNAFFADDLNGEGGLTDQEAVSHGVEAVTYSFESLLLSHVFGLQGVQHA